MYFIAVAGLLTIAKSNNFISNRGNISSYLLKYLAADPPFLSDLVR